MASGNSALALSLHSITTHNVKARTPPLHGIVSLAPSDFVIGAALTVAMVSFFWPSSKNHDEAVLMAGLSAALDRYPTLVGRLLAGGKVGLLMHAEQAFPMPLQFTNQSLLLFFHVLFSHACETHIKTQTIS